MCSSYFCQTNLYRENQFVLCLSNQLLVSEFSTVRILLFTFMYEILQIYDFYYENQLCAIFFVLQT